MKCSICTLPLKGSYIGTGDGSMKDGGSFSHPECYWRDRSQRMESALIDAIGLWDGYCPECRGRHCHTLEPIRCKRMDKEYRLKWLAGLA